MASEREDNRKKYPSQGTRDDWIPRLAAMAGKTPEELFTLLRDDPKTFISIAVSHGFQPPEQPKAKKQELKKYSLPSLGEMISGFGQSKPDESGPPIPSKKSPRSGWDWLVETIGRENAAINHKPYGEKAATSAPTASPPLNVSPGPFPPDMSATMVNTGDRGPAKSLDGTPTPSATPSSSATSVVPGAPNNATTLYPGASAGAAASRAAETASAPSSPPTDDLTKLAIGKALSGVKAPAPPNPLPGAGAHAPGSGSIPQSSIDDVLRALSAAIATRKRTSLKEAI